jgi:hypothetical protein
MATPRTYLSGWEPNVCLRTAQKSLGKNLPGFGAKAKPQGLFAGHQRPLQNSMSYRRVLQRMTISKPARLP